MRSDGFITLDIGAEGIRMTVFANGERGDTGFVAFDADLPADMAREAVVATALKRLLDEKKPAARKAVVSIEGRSVFSRLVKLPAVAPDRLKRTIEHEAVQNIPFPIGEVVWDALVVDPAAAEPEVLLVAVKAEVVEGLVHAVAANGLIVERIDVAPAALANAVRAATGATTDCVLLVDAGESSTNLVFVDGPRVFFRSLPVSGNDPAKLETEIDRSILFYKSQQGGAAPARILYSDDAALSVAAGLTARGPFGVDLVPAELRRDRAFRRKQPLLAACAVVVALTLGVWILGTRHATTRVRAEAVAVGARVGQLKAIEARMLPIEQELAELERTAAAYQAALAKRSFWKQTLEEISRRLPDGMFVLASEPIKKDEATIGTRVSIVSYLDKEPEGVDAVKSLRDELRASARFSDDTKVFSRPSRKRFAREFTLDVYFAEARP